MSNISASQFAALLLIPDTFAVLSLRKGVSMVTAAAFLIATMIQLVLAIPVTKLSKGKITVGGSAKVVQIIYFAYIILWGGILFGMLRSVSDILSVPTNYLPFIPEKLLISGLIAIVCIYASSGGFRILSRAAIIAAALGAVSITVIIIGALPVMSAENLGKSLSEGIFSEIIRGISLSGGMGTFVVLLSHYEGNPLKSAYSYLGARAVVWTAIILTTAASAGGIMRFTDFPVAAAAEISQPFASQRIDSLFLMMMAVLAVFSVSVQTAAAAELIHGIIPSFDKFRGIVCVTLMILVSALVVPDMYNIAIAAAVVFVLFIVPLIMNLTGRRRSR